MRPFLIATPCLALLLTGHPFAQEPRQPSRQDILERDGIIWGSAAAWGVPFQENLGEDAKIAGLSKLWMEVKINFPHSRRRSCPSRDRQSPRMLVGPRCLSATDVFAETFRRLQRGKLIGEPTGGSIGDPLAFALPGGGSARVATSAEVGSGLTGRGVQPDVLVPRTVKDFLAGHDAVLEAGLAELRASMKPR